MIRLFFKKYKNGTVFVFSGSGDRTFVVKGGKWFLNWFNFLLKYTHGRKVKMSLPPSEVKYLKFRKCLLCQEGKGVLKCCDNPPPISPITKFYGCTVTLCCQWRAPHAKLLVCFSSFYNARCLNMSTPHTQFLKYFLHSTSKDTIILSLYNLMFN